MIKSKLVNGKGKQYAALVNENGALNVVEHPHPPKCDTFEVLPFRARLTDSNGVFNMNVNGSTLSQDFSVKASSDYDIYIKTIFVEIEDGGAPALNKFGALSALTNGVEILYFNQKRGFYTIHDGIKTNKEFIRIGIDTHGIGTGSDAYLADVSGGGTSKSYLPIIDFGEMTGMRYGIKLKKASTDRLVFRINDNLTGLVNFDAIAYGLRME
jgi:hypothetical protein